MIDYINTAVAVVGLACIFIGCWWLHPAAAMIVEGGLLVFIAYPGIGDGERPGKIDRRH